MNIENGTNCPVCGQGTVYKHFRREDFEYKDRKKVLENYPVLVCDSCEEEFISPEDTKPFEKELTNFQREVDGLLKPEEIRYIRESLGYSQTKFANLLKVGTKNFARYETGITPQSRYLDWLMRIFRDHPEVIRVIDSKNVKPPVENSIS